MYTAEMTALIAAVRGGSGNLRIVQMILQHLPESVHLRDVYDMTALSWAVKNVPHHDDDDDNDDDDEDIVRAVDPASADATKARRMIALLLDAGADPSARVQFQNELLDFVRDNVTHTLLSSSKLLALQRKIQRDGRKFAICFKGQTRTVFPRLFPTIRKKIVQGLTMNGRHKVHLFAVQAGDPVTKTSDPGFNEHMFAPLKPTGLLFYSAKNQDARTLLSANKPLQMRSCFQYGIRGGSYGALEGLLHVVQDVGRCMDVIETAEAESNDQYTHVAMTRFDTIPEHALVLSQFKDIDLDSHIYVPSFTRLGVDDTFAIGPRRHMAKYLRGMLDEFARVFSAETKCEQSMVSEHFIRHNMVRSGLPTRHSPLVDFVRFGVDPVSNELVQRARL